MTSIQVRKQSRKSNPKVKTGCKTCKIRRVKCDEAKPSCLRCTSTGRECDGYPPINNEFQIQIWSRSTSRPQHALSVLTEFGDNVRYLEFYHHCALPALSSNFDKEFWSRIALQMAHSEPAVRHALIALGYLYETEPGSMKHARSTFAAATNERGTLLSHYNKSVRHLVDRIAEPNCPPEIALVTCVLFICIEFMRGNYHTGFTHLTNGLKIISQRQQRQRGNSLLSTTTASSEINLKEPIGTTAMIEEKLVPIFIRGIASALMYGVNAEKVFNMPWPTQTSLKQRPFATFLEAQEACHELRNACIVQIRTMATKFFHQSPISAEDIQRQNDLLDCHSSWIRNLENLEQEQQLSRDEKIAASALRASHYSTFIYIACAAEIRQTPYDVHLESFKKILHHTKTVIDSNALTTSYAARFTFDISIIPPLYFVACRCRCPTTRREAVSLLARNPPREGLWDAEQHVVVTKRVIEMEESDIDPETGWPVEESRLWSSVIDANMDRNGDFWVSFLPARWLGQVGPEVLKTKLIWERLHL